MPNKKITILEIVPSLQNGGVEQVLYNYLSHLNDKTLDITILTQLPSHPKAEKRFKDLGIKIVSIPTKKKHPIKHFRQLFALLKTNRYDIVHCHMSSRCYAFLWAAKHCKIKHRIAHAHSIEHFSNFSQSLTYSVFRTLTRKYANIYVACNQTAGKYLFKKHHFTILKNAFNLSNYLYDSKSRRRLRQKLNIPESALVIGQIGRFSTEKNQSFSLKIFAKLQQKNNKSSRLIFIGDGPTKKQIIQEAINLKINDHVIVLPPTSNVAKYYSLFDILILPSKYEGFGMVAAEAQVSNLLVIASTNVPNDVIMSHNSLRLPLDQPKLWIGHISNSTKSPRQSNLKLLKNHNLDISHEADNLAKLYHSLMQK